jgi:DNA end-binding protein Ku
MASTSSGGVDPSQSGGAAFGGKARPGNVVNLFEALKKSLQADKSLRN